MKCGPSRTVDSVAGPAAGVPAVVVGVADGDLAVVVVAVVADAASRGGSLTASGPVFQKCAQAVAAAGMPQLAQRFSFDLPDALARHGKVLPYLFERVLAPVFQPKPHLNDLLFARR